MRSCDKDCVSRNAVHVDAGGSFNVIHVDVTILGDEVNDIILGAHLKESKTRCYETVS